MKGTTTIITKGTGLIAKKEDTTRLIVKEKRYIVCKTELGLIFITNGFNIIPITLNEISIYFKVSKDFVVK